MKSNSLADTYEPQLQKSMKTVLCSRFISEYGFMGGKEVIELIVNDLLKIVNEHQLPLSKVKKGQILWQAVAKDETSSYGKSMSDTRTIPVILTLVSDEDINMRINGVSITQIRKNITERIMKEADEQRGTLSQPDIALLLAISRASVGKYIHEIQNEKGTTLPYRGTIHDMGPTITHKREIVRLRLQKLSTPEIARRTNHSEEAVDRYINDYERVIRISDIFEPIDIAFITNLSESLVIEYLDLKKEFQIGA
jgi:biotin operon repressor